jgi:hypothetical protein
MKTRLEELEQQKNKLETTLFELKTEVKELETQRKQLMEEIENVTFEIQVREDCEVCCFLSSRHSYTTTTNE